ncbi:MAG: DUF3341 domain-containing protein [Ignavibacteria bacterium]|nr:DUF3341 domain-containing protein [Ignavibacteria bacterium]
MSRRLLVTVFEDELDIVNATRTARENRYNIVDVYTPFAVHGLDEAMGLKPSKLGWVCFALGLAGAVAKLWFQIWTSSQSWPVNVGGKPLSSVPAFVPVTFEIMVLFAGVGTVITFFALRKLFPGKKPHIVYEGATNNRFILVLEQSDAAFDLRNVRTMFEPFNLVAMEERIDKEKK